MASSAVLLLGGITASLGVLYVLNLLRRRKTIIQGKVVLITGASSGLGEACAHAFYRAGAHVILCARRQDQLERVKNQLIKTKTTGSTFDPHVVTLDLGDLNSIPDKAQQALSIHGRVDILINNGGISFRGDVCSTNIDVDVHVMTVNYFGTVALTKALLPQMVERRSGHILCVSSVQGRIAIPFRSAYAASKHALQAFSDSLRAEVSHHNIHVSVFSPSYISTNLSVNAVMADGSAYGVTDSTTASGMSTTYAANKILSIVTYQQKDIVLASLVQRAAIYLRTLWPALFFKLMRSRAAKERQKTTKAD